MPTTTRSLTSLPSLKCIRQAKRASTLWRGLRELFASRWRMAGKFRLSTAGSGDEGLTLVAKSRESAAASGLRNKEQSKRIPRHCLGLAVENEFTAMRRAPSGIAPAVEHLPEADDPSRRSECRTRVRVERRFTINDEWGALRSFSVTRIQGAHTRSVFIWHTAAFRWLAIRSRADEAAYLELARRLDSVARARLCCPSRAPFCHPGIPQESMQWRPTPSDLAGWL